MYIAKLKISLNVVKFSKMKLLILIFCFITINVNAQNLNYNDLKNILSKTIVDSNDYLENKGYRIYETNSSENDNQLAYIWDKEGKSNFSVSYLVIAWDEEKGFKHVWYQYHTLSHFNQLKGSIEQLGFKLTNSYVKFESLYYEYTSSDYKASLSKGDKSYTFSIVYNPDKLISKEIIPKF
jgi:hypothetical protein